MTYNPPKDSIANIYFTDKVIPLSWGNINQTEAECNKRLRVAGFQLGAVSAYFEWITRFGVHGSLTLRIQLDYGHYKTVVGSEVTLAEESAGGFKVPDTDHVVSGLASLCGDGTVDETTLKSAAKTLENHIPSDLFKIVARKSNLPLFSS